MKKVLALAVLGLMAAATAPAAEQTVTFKSGSEQASGFLVTPEGKGPFPAVVVVPEWWGLVDWVKGQARTLAKDGYVALAVDVYRGKSTSSQEEAHQLMMGTPPERVVRDLQAAFAHLESMPTVRKDRIGAIGWCMGGGYTLQLATTEPKLAAAVAYYGLPPTDPAKIAAIHAPVLGNYGAEDKGPSPEQARAFEAAMKKAGKTIDLKIYPGAGHAFANVNNPWGGYRKEAAADAWARTTAFLAKYLKG
jgi:carboxymethylenebutenolidase